MMYVDELFTGLRRPDLDTPNIEMWWIEMKTNQTYLSIQYAINSLGML